MLHCHCVPDRFIRIAPDGRISYSQRLTVTARCQMDFHKFPLDSQTCSLFMGSFGFDRHDIVYQFTDTPLHMDQLELAEYNLVRWTHGHTTNTSRNSVKSRIYFTFQFQRAVGFYILQVCMTLIMMSN